MLCMVCHNALMGTAVFFFPLASTGQPQTQGMARAWPKPRMELPVQFDQETRLGPVCLPRVLSRAHPEHRKQSCSRIAEAVFAGLYCIHAAIFCGRAARKKVSTLLLKLRLPWRRRKKERVVMVWTEGACAERQVT